MTLALAHASSFNCKNANDESFSDTCPDLPLSYLDKMIYLMMYTIHASDGKAPDRIAVCQATLEDLFNSKVCKVEVQAMKWFPDGLYRNVRRKLRVPLIDFVSSQSYELRYTGKGDESLWDGFKNGDVLVRLNVVPHERFSISRQNMRDLVTTCRISLFDFYSGGKTVINQLDGREIEIHFDFSHQSSDNMQVIVQREGLPYNCVYDMTITQRLLGELCVNFEVVLPQFPERILRNFAFRCAMKGAFSSWTTKGLGHSEHS